MKPLKHQIEKAEEAWSILHKTGYVYVAGKPRSGKTITSIVLAEKSDQIKDVVIFTTKGAIGYPKKLDKDGNILTDSKGKEILVTTRNSKYYIEDNEEGWLDTLKKTTSWRNHSYDIYNYEQASKITKKYDLAIIDESHNLGVLGKVNNRILNIRKVCKDIPHIHLSGTAIVESPNGIYHQMWISKFTPFRFKNFYDYFRFFGKPYYIKVAGREIQQYDKADTDRLMSVINDFTVYMTQEDAGISKDLQAKDVIHYIELNKKTKEFYNTLQKDLVIELWEGILAGKPRPEKTYTLMCDTVMKLRTSLHMIESGVVKIDDKYIMLGNTEKIDYIKNTWGDHKYLGNMCHFIGERILLKNTFKHAQAYSSSSHAEGVDLSHLENFVIISSDYRGSKFIQRRDRIVNIKGSKSLDVNHLLVKGGISEQVYKKVSKKEDFNNSTYEKLWL